MVTGAERTSAWPIVQEAAQRFQLEIRPIRGRSRAATIGPITSCWRAWEFRRSPSRRGSKVTGQADDFAAQQFREYNTKHYHQPSDEYREDWDFASLEHVARFGYLVGLNIANCAADAEVERGGRVRQTVTR